MRYIKVMLVDDNTEFRTALRGFFETQESVGVVAEATDGVEAVEQARNVHPDLILMDITMPRMDGFSATQEIKKESPGTAIVFVSAYDEEKYRRSAREMGAEAFISKASLAKELPAVLETMKERVKRAAILLRKGDASVAPGEIVSRKTRRGPSSGANEKENMI